MGNSLINGESHFKMGSPIFIWDFPLPRIHLFDLFSTFPDFPIWPIEGATSISSLQPEITVAEGAATGSVPRAATEDNASNRDAAANMCI